MPMNDKQPKNARETALKTIYDVTVKGAYLNIALEENLKRTTLDARDTGFAVQLSYGTIEKLSAIDYILKLFLKKDKLHPWVKAVLRMGVYQIMYLDSVPSRAACSQSLQLTEKYGPKKLKGLVNGVLRNVVRQRDEIKWPDEKNSPIDYLSVISGWQKWILTKWQKEYDVETAKKIALAKKDDFTSVSINSHLYDEADVIDKLMQASINYETSPVDGGLRIIKYSNLSGSMLYKDGYLQPQGESSRLSVNILNPKSGERVLDMCAAPGGKTIRAAVMMQDIGIIDAWDIHPHRVKLIDKNIKRISINSINTKTTDGRIFNIEIENSYDKVLLDAPCTGWGVARKRPDIKLKTNKKAVEDIIKLQAELLINAGRYVKHGGYLLYSTCTLNPDENHRQIDAFLEKNNDFECITIEDQIPSQWDYISRDRAVEILPGDGADGFFIALMRKKMEQNSIEN